MLVFQMQLPEAAWQTYTRRDLAAVDGPVAVGVGLSDRKEVVSIDLDTSPHVAIIGSSQVSGKSTMLLSFLVGLMEKLSPGELQVLMVDPAGDCADKLVNAAHLVMPPATTAAQAAMVIDRAMDEKEEREKARVRAGSGLPMFVLVIDEAQSIVPKADRQRMLATLGETVAKLDMHLVVATQKPLEETLPGLMFNLSTRLVGYVPTSREATLLTGLSSDDAPAHRLTQRGEFLHIRGGHVSRFTVAMATDEDVAQLPVNGKLRWPDLAPAVEEEPNRGGRPSVQLEGRAVGHYLMAMLNGNSISEKVARESLGLKYTGHRLNRDFATDVFETMEALGYEE
jgi:DNA segregation ATPase FtsK/SpoIIIE-like protein